jgi:hypothetical protein
MLVLAGLGCGQLDSFVLMLGYLLLHTCQMCDVPYLNSSDMLSLWYNCRALVEGAEGEAKQELSEGQLRLGLVECLNHSLLHPYPVLHEKQGDLVAQVGMAGC